MKKSSVRLVLCGAEEAGMKGWRGHAAEGELRLFAAVRT